MDNYTRFPLLCCQLRLKNKTFHIAKVFVKDKLFELFYFVFDQNKLNNFYKVKCNDRNLHTIKQVMHLTHPG